MKYIFLLLLCCLTTAHAPRARQGKDYAIFFANDTYPNGWDRLRFPLSDADKIATELKNHYGFETTLYANKTREEILNLLSEWQRKNYGPDDQLLVFFSGHGHYDNYCTGYYVPKDGRGNDPGGSSYLEWSSIQNRLGASNCRHLLLMADACFAGTADLKKTCPQLFDGTKGPRDPINPNAGSERDRFINATLRDRSRLYYAAAGAVTTNDRSDFARLFLDALQHDYDRNSILDMATLRKRLKIAQPVPQFSTFGGNEDAEAFLFIRKAAEKTVSPSIDRDGDGVPDAADACPDRYGTQANGCPPDLNPSSTTADTDGDGTPNDRDACPDEYGTAKARGCPDADDDGVPDKSDKCRYLTGEPRWEGCPDSDSDGIPDHLDRCPDQKGAPADNGCLPADRDQDGIPDKGDRCPDTPGKANFGGCPDTDGDGIPDPDDKCPKEKGTALWEGCPDPTPVAPDGMVFVQGGTFTMGSPTSEKDRSDDETQHSVTLSSFYIGKYEVTQAEWVKVMGSNPSNFKNCDQCPVENVSWADIQEFLKKLNAQTGKKYRLPTEAEWEYAARGGQTGARDAFVYAGSNNIDEVAWYGSNSDSKTHSVGGKKANQLGLYDMTGNVWEWCSDWYGTYPTSAQTDPKGAGSGGNRVYRGGSWYNGYPQSCRAAYRGNSGPTSRFNVLGFRLVLQ